MATQLDSGTPGSAHPTGTVTFLFTDIEGSTQRWDRNRSAMQDAVRRHDALMERTISAHDGYVFKTFGDAFCVAFSRPEDAVAAIVDAQRALDAEDFSAIDELRVRAAVHTGTADERNGDYFGPALNRVARLLAIGHGGQVLVSGATRELVRADLPMGTSLLDLGTHLLKDLAEPEHVSQLTIEGLPHAFPLLRSVDAGLNNLPITRTSFVGRESVVAEVKGLLDRKQLLTLVGSGGVGKTRVAIQVAADLLDRYPDGVWFVDLAPIDNPELVASVVAQTLGMSQRQTQRIDESIPLWLKRKKLLLIFDNCEHVLEPIAALAAAVLSVAKDVCILATSRQALNIGGEATHLLPSLDVPAETGGLSSGEALEYGAVALFVDRAKAANTRFVLTDNNAPLVAQICRRLDGIALAIELAASRVKVLSISNLAQRLNERFKLLTGGSRNALPRQKTLTALIDWSYDLLTSQEQTLFTRVGIFAGGFSLDAATAVCSDPGHRGRVTPSEVDERRSDDTDVLDLLASLTDKSLVTADTSGEYERYSLLESTRAYALEKLTATGAHDQLARYHAQYFREQAETVHEQRHSDSTSAWVGGFELELDNYRAALDWALSRENDAVLGGAIAGALGAFWWQAGLSVEGRFWFERALPRISEAEQPVVAGRLHLVLCRALSGKRRYESAQRAMQLFESAGDRHDAMRAQRAAGYALIQMGQLDAAHETFLQLLATSRECGDARETAYSLGQLAVIEKERGDTGTARELYAQALARYEALGDDVATADLLSSMAEFEFAMRNPAEALRLANEALKIDLGGKNAGSIAADYCNMAAYQTAVGALEAAHDSARDGLRFARQAQGEQHVTVALEHLALLLALGGDPRRATQLLGYVGARYEQLGMQRGGTEQWGYDKLQITLRDALGDGEIEKFSAEGAAWSEDGAIAAALLEPSRSP